MKTAIRIEASRSATGRCRTPAMAASFIIEPENWALTCSGAGVGSGAFRLPLLVVETPEAPSCNITKPLYEAAVAHSQSSWQNTVMPLTQWV